MTYVLDTHTWIWSIDCPDRIPAHAFRVMSDMRNAPLGLSAISAWEVAKKEAIGKLQLSQPVEDWLSLATSSVGLEILPLTPEIALDSANLPGTFHNDPADQIIVATARRHHATLITGDRRIRRYRHVKTLWR